MHSVDDKTIEPLIRAALGSELESRDPGNYRHVFCIFLGTCCGHQIQKVTLILEVTDEQEH